jgi:hypothetical protein
MIEESGVLFVIRDIERIGKAKEIIQKLASGIDPTNGEEIINDHILSDPRIIRMFFFVSEVLDNVIKGEYSKDIKLTDFIITPEQKESVIFTEGDIGVNEVSRCINKAINPLVSKKVSGLLINKGLKRMGILTEVENNDGKRRTTINEISQNYGFSEVKRSYEGREYMQVVANDMGKKFILDNIEEIMEKDKD